MNPVEALYRDHEAILQHLQQGEPSFHGYLENSLPKVLLLAAASEFEHRISEEVRSFVHEITSGNEAVTTFAESKGISRQFHTYFDWKAATAMPFFGLFGPTVKANAKSRLANDAQFKAAMSDFLVLGQLRNQLVHGNYAAFALDKTSAELFALYESANYFITELPALLRVAPGADVAVED